jgi:hypothetical protein
MKRVLISLAWGLSAYALLGCAYVATRYFRLSITTPDLLASLIVFAIGISTAAFALNVTVHTHPKKLTSSSRLNDPPGNHFFRSLFPKDVLHLRVGTETTIERLAMRHEKVFGKSPELNTKLIMTIKKGDSADKIFNPLVLEQIFSKLKQFPNFLDILLVNQHDEFIGYLPAFYARANFGVGSASQITKWVINILANPASSEELRTIGGMGKDDTISDSQTVADAAKKLWGGLKRGLIVLKGTRNRKPIGILFSEDVYEVSTKGG